MSEKILSLDETNKLDSKLKKELDDVRQVIYQTSMDFHNYIFPKYINNYKKYLWFVAERIANIDGWQSNINYPMVSSAVDTMFSNIFDFGYQFWVSEESLKRMCTKSFDFRNTWKKVLEEIIKECLIVWKWYVKDYFIKEEFSEEFFWNKIKKDIKIPSMYYISVFDVLYDRSKWLDQSSYKIVRTFVSWDSIEKKVLPLILENYSTEDKKKAKTKFKSLLKSYKDKFWARFSMYDYNPVKSLTATSQWMNSDTPWNYYTITNCNKVTELLWWYAPESSMSEDSKNYFLNDNKSTYELVEYYTSDKKYIFINWNIIYFGDKKYNLWEIREATFSKIPWTWNASWISDKLTTLQDLQNTLWNAFIDNIKLNMGPMFKVSWNLPMWKNGTLDFKAFKAFRTNGTQDIEKIQLWVQDFAPMNFMQMVEATWLKESWMNNYVTGWGWSIERTQAWVDVKFNQYKSKLTPLTDSIDQLMWNIARSWIIMFFKFYTKEELLKVWITIQDVYVKDSTWKEIFDTYTVNWIDLKTIIDENNISFTYNSLDKITKENARDTIIMNLQYMLQYIPRQIDMTELWKLLSWKDFNPEKILTEEKPWYNKQQFNNYNQNWANNFYEKKDYNAEWYKDNQEWDVNVNNDEQWQTDWWQWQEELLNELANIV